MTTTVATAPVIAPDTTQIAVGQKGMAILARLREIGLVEKAARDLKKEKEALAADFAALTGGAKYATYMGVKAATRIDSHSTIVDTEKLLEAFPEAHEACVSEKPYSYYRQA